jgi:hypothetical protein
LRLPHLNQGRISFLIAAFTDKIDGDVEWTVLCENLLPNLLPSLLHTAGYRRIEWFTRDNVVHDSCKVGFDLGIGSNGVGFVHGFIVPTARVLSTAFTGLPCPSGVDNASVQHGFVSSYLAPLAA